jgi:O-antigen ligase
VLAYAGSKGEVYGLEKIEGDWETRYLLLGRVCGPGALVALAGWLYARQQSARWFFLGLFLTLCFVLAIGGGRGPLLSTVLPLLIPIALGIRFTRRRIRYWRTLLSVLVLVFVAAGGLALYTIISDQRLPTFDRLERLAEGNPRIELYARWAELWPQAPLFGHGAGSWGLLWASVDRASYPHNLFLELMVENGLVGLVLFLALLGAAFRPASLDRLRHDPQALCAVMLFVGALSNAMTSGDLIGNRAVFLMLGVLALFAVRPAVAGGRARVPRQAVVPLDLSIARRRQATAERMGR